jgi:hypothetical protein
MIRSASASPSDAELMARIDWPDDRCIICLCTPTDLPRLRRRSPHPRVSRRPAS